MSFLHGRRCSFFCKNTREMYYFDIYIIYRHDGTLLGDRSSGSDLLGDR